MIHSLSTSMPSTYTSANSKAILGMISRRNYWSLLCTNSITIYAHLLAPLICSPSARTVRPSIAWICKLSCMNCWQATLIPIVELSPTLKYSLTCSTNCWDYPSTKSASERLRIITQDCSKLMDTLTLSCFCYLLKLATIAPYCHKKESSKPSSIRSFSMILCQKQLSTSFAKYWTTICEFRPHPPSIKFTQIGLRSDSEKNISHQNWNLTWFAWWSSSSTHSIPPRPSSSTFPS